VKGQSNAKEKRGEERRQRRDLGTTTSVKGSWQGDDRARIRGAARKLKGEGSNRGEKRNNGEGGPVLRKVQMRRKAAIYGSKNRRNQENTKSACKVRDFNWPGERGQKVSGHQATLREGILEKQTAGRGTWP